MKSKKSPAIRATKEDKVLYGISYVLMVLLIIVVLYPVIFIVSSSFSSGTAVSAGKVLFLPVEFTLTGYKLVFSYKAVWSGYANTLFYTIVGTALNLFLTVLAAYPLSRRDFYGRGLYMTLFMITMFFSGGMIPKYILMSNLHLVNTRWAVLLSGAISITNMIIMRTYFMSSIPSELLEAARMDGITDFGYLMKIVLPLSKTVLAVITLYYAVGHWNSYFTAMMYLRDRDMRPLQMVLRDILNAANVDLSEISDPELLLQLTGSADVMKFALVVVATVPILCMYPFVQKYFEKGVMIGSVKG